MVTIDGDERLRLFRYKRDNRRTADERRNIGGKLHCGFACGWFRDAYFLILATVGDSSFQIKISNRKLRLCLCFMEHQTVKKKFEDTGDTCPRICVDSRWIPVRRFIPF